MRCAWRINLVVLELYLVSSAWFIYRSTRCTKKSLINQTKSKFWRVLHKHCSVLRYSTYFVPIRKLLQLHFAVIEKDANIHPIARWKKKKKRTIADITSCFFSSSSEKYAIILDIAHNTKLEYRWFHSVRNLPCIVSHTSVLQMSDMWKCSLVSTNQYFL